MGAYGYVRDTTPVFDALAEESLLFEHAYVPYTASTASHTSIQTGCLPAEPRRGDQRDVDPARRADPGPRTCRERGYTTAAFHNHGLLTPAPRLRTGLRRVRRDARTRARGHPVPRLAP